MREIIIRNSYYGLHFGNIKPFKNKQSIPTGPMKKQRRNLTQDPFISYV